MEPVAELYMPKAVCSYASVGKLHKLWGSKRRTYVRDHFNGARETAQKTYKLGTTLEFLREYNRLTGYVGSGIVEVSIQGVCVSPSMNEMWVQTEVTTYDD